jgi:hypothetical protein
MEKEVVLKTFIHRYEADIAKGLLDEKGIENMISDDDVGGFRPGMIIGESIQLIVNENDLSKAKVIIKIMVITCSLWLAGTVAGFTDYVQGPGPNILMQERLNQKMVFDYHQAIYNDNANTKIRAEDLIEKKDIKKNQDKKRVEEIQDQTKGQILVKF